MRMNEENLYMNEMKIINISVSSVVNMQTNLSSLQFHVLMLIDILALLTDQLHKWLINMAEKRHQTV